MTVRQIGDGLVAKCRAGQVEEAVDTYYAADIVSVEAQGEHRESLGLDQVRAKMDW